MPNTDLPANERVSYGEQSWCMQVRIAEAMEGICNPRDPGYEFSNGRKFDSGLGPYANPAA